VVKPGGVVGVPDVHARAGAHRFEAFEDLDVVGGIGRYWVLYWILQTGLSLL
jgi:hypothetical protein